MRPAHLEERALFAFGHDDAADVCRKGELTEREHICSVWDESTSCSALMFISPTFVLRYAPRSVLDEQHSPRSTSLPSLTPPSVTSKTEPCGSCNAPECKSSFLLSGENGVLLSLLRERGSVRERGRSCERICERAGKGCSGASSSATFIVLGTGTEGNRESVRDGQRSGGLRD